MTLEQATRDPMFLKAAGAVTIWVVAGDNRTARWAAAALAAWAAWDWYSRPRLAVNAAGQVSTLAPIGTRPPLSVLPGGLGIRPAVHQGSGAVPSGMGGKGGGDVGDWKPPPGSTDWIQGDPSDGAA